MGTEEMPMLDSDQSESETDLSTSVLSEDISATDLPKLEEKAVRDLENVAFEISESQEYTEPHMSEISPSDVRHDVTGINDNASTSMENNPQNMSDHQDGDDYGEDSKV